MKYPKVSEALNTYFDYNSGDDWERRFPEALESSIDWRTELVAEMRVAMVDDDFLWLPLLKYAAIATNEEVATEAEAKAWVQRRVIDQYLSPYFSKT